MYTRIYIYTYIYIYVYYIYIYIYIYIHIYIYTYVHENRSIPVLSIPFQRVFVITCVRTLVHIFNRRHGPKIPRIHAIIFDIQFDSNRAGSYFTRVDFPKVHAQ